MQLFVYNVHIRSAAAIVMLTANDGAVESISIQHMRIIQYGLDCRAPCDEAMERGFSWKYWETGSFTHQLTSVNSYSFCVCNNIRYIIKGNRTNGMIVHKKQRGK